jgi:zinc protease
MRTVRVSALLLIAAVAAACQPGTARSDRGPGDSQAAAAPRAAAENPPPPASVSQRLVSEPDRRVLRLSNGFTVILQRNPTAPVVAARVYVRAGALTEQQHMGAGISHVLEHLVAGASSGKRQEAENTLLLQQIGNDSNAYTDEDHTCYFITTTAEKWPVAMDLLVDWTTNTNFTREQFEREYKVVQRELEMGESEADRTFYLQTQATRYLESPARHPVIGYKPAFQRLTFEDCKAYFQKMYVPDNMVISVAGDIDLDRAEGLILDQVKGIARKAVAAISLPPEPPVSVPRTSVARADLGKARVEWAFPTVSMHHPDLYAADVLASVLGGGESSILVRKLRNELGLVLAVDCSNPTPSYVEGQMTVDAVVDPDKIPAAQAALLAALADVVKNGVPADAVDRAKAQAAAGLVYGNQTAEQQASRNALDFLAMGSVDFSKAYVARIQAVTPADVQAVAKKYLVPDRLLTTALLPLNAADPFVPKAAAAAQQTAGAVRKMVLKNGVTLLISRNPAAPLASFHLYALGGLLAEDDATNGTGSAMMEMLTRGTTTRSHDQIADFLDATGTTLSPEAGNNSFALSMQCLKDRAPEAAALFADVALHPAFSQQELDSLRPQLLAAIEQSTEDWFSEGYKAVRGAYFAQSPYKRLAVGNADVVAKLTPAALRAHYERFFLNPQKMVLAISGDIDPAAAAAWAAPFEATPAPPAAPPLHLASTPAAPTVITRHTEKGSASVMFAFPPGMTATDPDRYAMTVLQTYLGGYSSPGGSVLHDTLRGKGLVYNVQAMNFVGPAPGMFLIYTLGEPQNTAEILSTVAQIVAAAKAGNIPDGLLAAAKDQAITGERLSKQTIGDKASAEALDELLGLGFDEDARFPERIRAVTKADVVRVANRYLGVPVVVVTTPTPGEGGRQKPDAEGP